MKIIFITPQDAPEIFPKVKDFIGKALDRGHGEVSIDDIFFHVLQGIKQLWIVSDDKYKPMAAAITEINNYPQKRVMRILMLAGSGLDIWCEELENKFVEFAHKWQAKSIEVIGRKGWERQLKQYGYNQWYSYLGKDLEG